MITIVEKVRAIEIFCRRAIGIRNLKIRKSISSIATTGASSAIAGTGITTSNSTTSHDQKRTLVNSPEGQRQLVPKTMAPELVPKIEEADFFLDKVTCLSSLTPVSNINLKLTEKQRKMFECTCFGRLLEMDELVFSSQTVHELLLREAKSPNTDEMWFKLGDNRIRFSIQEFCIVTGVNCSPYPSVDVDKKVKGVGLIDSLLNGDMNLYNSTLEDVFMNASSNDDLIMVKLALLYFLENVLLGREKGSPIDSEHIILADDLDRFNEYPWGRVCFEMTMKSLQNALKGRVQMLNDGNNKKSKQNWEVYSVGGFPLGVLLQVYAFLQPTPEEEQQCYFQPFIALGSSKDQPTLMRDNTTSAASPPSSDVNAITDTMALRSQRRQNPPLKLLLCWRSRLLR
ncbi:hypothetical protein LWI29_001046 [Acer saccharum]|uniref:DUF1985 domain-containing protein n=1 Tax=Acer saccharum TaxID=4024 RepID=A0AA39VK11_ACESA|nr:hypothetical protein LWI29_001046 [Acer saccharum]